MSGVVSVECPARLICSMDGVLWKWTLGLRVCAFTLDFAEFMAAHLDGEFTKYGRRAAHDDVTRFHRADAVRRSGVEEVSRIERIEFRCELDETAAIVNE